MKYFVRMIVVFAAVLLVACSSMQANQLAQDQITVPLQAFNSVDAKGRFNLDIVFGAAQNQLQVSGIKNQLEYLQHKINREGQLTLKVPFYHSLHYPLQVTLFVSSKYLPSIHLSQLPSVSIDPQGKATIGQLTVDQVTQVCLKKTLMLQTLTISGGGALIGNGDIQLGTLMYKGSGSVYLEAVHSPRMSVYGLGSGQIELQGYGDVAQIYQGNTGQMKLSGLNSDRTLITVEKRGRLTLEGKSNKIVANLFNSTYFDAKALVTQTAYIRTHQNALAHVNAQKYLFAFALDRSQINYYEEPDHLYRQTEKAGVILPMF